MTRSDALALLVGLLLAMAVIVVVGVVTDTGQPAEDDPAWDCRIHGNEVCGGGGR
ncbi:hypothetical protein CLV30_11344 [Haloactinopolyspora alba]|uniref:Uncharacterized protein n=1 Tax=Haloactinopolyspora alba TaxID=648780 RepID=A0A2P8DWG2_9ACTN|nr:hypothetical protein [Haloactinopolyspora alba]PSL01556.1 hypothetical protein CLV30_11344 [Haloactinopolyspora alba]